MNDKRPTRPRNRRRNEGTVDVARTLRRDSTFPERKLWSVLRNGRLGGLKFRRQYVVGPFIVDFYCATGEIAIELDGMSHVGQAEHDENREEYLKSKGLTVIRFTNDEVLESLDAVATAIARACGLDW